MPNLVLLAGIPASGKSTYAKTFFDLKYAVVSSDAIREQLAGSLREAHSEDIKPWDIFYGKIAEYLRHDVDVVADATFLTRRHRERAREVAAQTDAVLHLVLFKNWFAASLRNDHRAEDTRVPDEVMTDMRDLFWNTLAEIAEEDYRTITKIEAFD